jgi:hypothetical protein
MMKKIMFLILVVLVFSRLVKADFMITEESATNLVNKYVEALMKADTVELNDLLDDSYVHIHGTGIIENKLVFLESLNSKDRIYGDVQTDIFDISIFENIAIVRSKIKISVLSKGVKLQAVNFMSMIIEYKNGKLHIVQFQATKLNEAVND